MKETKKITAIKAAELLKGKDVVVTPGYICKGEEIQFDEGEMIEVSSWVERITDSEPKYTVTELTSKDGYKVRFAE